MSFKRVLCPVDLSENSKQAVNLAAALVDRNGGELVLLHVAMPELPESSGFAIATVEAQIELEKRRLQEVRPDGVDGIRVRHEVRRGDPAGAITQVAAQEHCDLIVMTTHGRTGLARLLMGSVAEHVLRHATCPVLSLRTRETAAG